MTRGLKLVTREFQLITHRFELATRGFELATREFELVTREFELIIYGFELVTRGFELITCSSELLCDGPASSMVLSNDPYFLVVPQYDSHCSMSNLLLRQFSVYDPLLCCPRSTSQCFTRCQLYNFSFYCDKFDFKTYTLS